MKAEIEQLFEMLTCQFLKAFLSQCTQNPPVIRTQNSQRPMILLSDHPGTSPIHLTWRKSCLISCPDTLTP